MYKQDFYGHCKPLFKPAKIMTLPSLLIFKANITLKI